MKILQLVLLLVFFAGCGGQNQNSELPGSPNDPIIDTGGQPWKKHRNTRTHPRYTRFCKIDASGAFSSDSISVEKKGDRFEGVGGGCIPHPIRTVWEETFNHQNLKSSQLDELEVTARPDLVDRKKKMYFVFDLKRIVNPVVFVTIAWTMRTTHTVNVGNYKVPKQISVNMRKLETDGQVKVNIEGYVIEEVNPEMTSFTVLQTVEAPRVSEATITKSIQEVIDKVRKGSPDRPRFP